MTEQQWLRSKDCVRMLCYLLHAPREFSYSATWYATELQQIRAAQSTEIDCQQCLTERKMRLFVCACCRRLFDQCTQETSRQAVEAAEAYIEGHIGAGHLQERWVLAYMPFAYGVDTADSLAAKAARRPVEWRATRLIEPTVQCRLLRDIVGNPFRPVALQPAWRTETAVSLAQAIYDERAFDRLPILGDALEDAGCNSVDILNHCREPGDHARGCWPLDLILGKS